MSRSYVFEVSSKQGGVSRDIDIPKQLAKVFEGRYGYGTHEQKPKEVYALRQLVAVLAALKPINHPVELDTGEDEDVNTDRPGWYRLYKDAPETGELVSSKEDIEVMAKLRWWSGRFARHHAADGPFDVYNLDSWFFDECFRMLETLDEMASIVETNKDAVVRSVIS